MIIVIIISRWSPAFLWTLVKIEIISKLRILFYFGPELYLDSRDDVKLKGHWIKGIQGCVAISSISSSINIIIIILINTILYFEINTSLPCSEWVWIWRWVWRTMLKVQVDLLLQQKIFGGTYFTTGIFPTVLFVWKITVWNISGTIIVTLLLLLHKYC